MKSLYLLISSILICLIFAGPAFCQAEKSSILDKKSVLITKSNPASTPDSTSTKATGFPKSVVGSLEHGWYGQLGEMPVFIPDLIPNSMTIITPPAVDQKIVIQLRGTATDTVSSGRNHRDEE